MSNWCIIDVELGEVIRLHDTKKQAQEDVKMLRWCDKWIGERRKYVIEKEENI